VAAEQYLAQSQHSCQEVQSRTASPAEHLAPTPGLPVNMPGGPTGALLNAPPIVVIDIDKRGWVTGKDGVSHGTGSWLMSPTTLPSLSRTNPCHSS
jgi:hypothetical protein